MKNTIPNKYAHIEIVDFTNYAYDGYVIAKIRTGLWLVTDNNGDYINHTKAKKTALEVVKQLVEEAKKVIKEVKKTTNRVAKRLVTGNVMKFGFGQKISENTTKNYIKKAWNGVFKVVNAEIVNGYWGGVVEHVKTGEQFQVVRLDYVINYIRAPKGTDTLEDVRNVMVERGVALA